MIGAKPCWMPIDGMKKRNETGRKMPNAAIWTVPSSGEPLQCENALLSEKLIVEPTNCMRNGERPIASTRGTRSG